MGKIFILPVKADYHIWYPRGPYGSERGNGKTHGGLDICAIYGTAGLAPEGGLVVWHWFERNGFSKPTVTWPGGTQYDFGAWCASPYGGVAVLYGDSGKIYLYCHMELAQIREMCKQYEISLFEGTAKAGGTPVKVYHTLDNYVRVKAGDIVALMGSAGQSSEPHFHFEEWEGGRRFDPFNLWPEKSKEFVDHYRRE